MKTERRAGRSVEVPRERNRKVLERHIQRKLRKPFQEGQRLQQRDKPRTCVYCGCTDERACEGGCWWIEKHTATATGVCSGCGTLATRMALARLVQ